MEKYVGQIRNPVHVILFTILTCHIYGAYWHYNTIKDFNSMRDKQIVDPTLWLVLVILAPIASLYLIYTYEKNLIEICAEEGIPYEKENFIIWLVLSFVSGVGLYMALYQLQTKLNEIWINRGAEPPVAGS